jgi:gas vesicle protein
MRDDERYIVIEKDRGISLGSFVLGALLGAGAALLLAPQTGEEAQEELRKRAKQLRAEAETRVKEAQKTIEHRIGEARTDLEGRVEQVRTAVDAGRDAAQEYRGQLEDKLERSKSAYRAGIDAAREEMALAASTDGSDPAEDDSEGAEA